MIKEIEVKRERLTTLQGNIKYTISEINFQEEEGVFYRFSIDGLDYVITREERLTSTSKEL